MQLSELLKDSDLPASADRLIKRITLDSRKVMAGDLFLAIKGTHSNGEEYIPDAIQKGAAAVLINAVYDKPELTWQDNVPIIAIERLPARIGELAAHFYGDPAKKMHIIGVTGTNGKTSSTHFLAQVLEALGVKCGLIGTLGSGFYGALGEPGLTTPDAISLEALLADFYEKGAKAVAMEVSSHSLDQGRVNGIEFECGIFTNLTQDHLDYHGTMERYAAVKYRFFTDYPMKHAILNADDSHGLAWLQTIENNKQIYAYSVGELKTDLPPFIKRIYADNVKLSLQGMEAMVHTPWGEGQLNLSLIGQFNLSNALGVLTALCTQGYALEKVLPALSHVQSVPGRMQMLGGKNQPLVVVDYAHTPDALEKVLQALRHHTNGKLICVFGCGGDRDQTKRPQMAKIAEHWADTVIVTNDNPRHEDPKMIAKQIWQGFTQQDKALLELDRSKAIEKSIQLASVNDCILIAGKGAERYQQVGDQKIPFCDVEEVTRCLQ